MPHSLAKILGNKVIIASLIFLLSFSVALNIFLFKIFLDYQGAVQNLTKLVEDFQRRNVELEKSIEILMQQVRYPSLAHVPPTGDWIYVAAVNIQQTEIGVIAKGEIIRIYARFIPGSGKVLITTQPKIGIDLQASAETAYMVAQKVSGIDASNLDVIITVTANRTIEVIDGPSAGVAITTLLYFSLKGQEVPKEVLMTGEIRTDGSIGRVGGIIEKAIAVAQLNKKMFLVPEGQSVAVIWVKKTTSYGIFEITTYTTKTVNVEDYLRGEGYDIDIVEVGTIFDVLRLFS